MDPTQLMAMLTGGMDPMALGSTMANNPEAIAMQMASQGVPPPALPPSPAMGGTDMFSGSTPLEGPPPMPQPRPPEGPTTPYVSSPDPGLDNVGQAPQLRTFNNMSALDVPAGLPQPPAPTPPLAGPTAADADQGYSPGVPVPPVVAQGNGGGAGRGISFAGAGAPREGTPDAQAPGSKTQDLLKAMQGIKAPAPPQPQRVSTPSPMRPNQLPANNNLVQLLAAATGNAPDVKQVLLSQLLLGGPRGR
jgi:hypothetical protein